MTRRMIALLILTLLPVESLLAQQEPRFKASANVVLVDVRVLDSNGKPVRGLTRGDFTVLEEGVPQNITYFREVSIPLPPDTSTTTLPEAAPASLEADRSPQPVPSNPGSVNRAALQPGEKRILILFFNLSSMDPQDIHFVQESARKFVQTGITPEDAAAVAVFDQGLYLLCDLTSRRDDLLAAINSLGEANAELDNSSSDDTSGEFIADLTELSLFETNQQLSAIQSITEAFQDVPGRKAILYFTPGLTADAIENTDEMRVTTDIANRSNTSVYTIDSRGLVALSPGGGATGRGGGGTSIFNGRAALGQLSSLAQSQEGLVTLAADTGGYALLDDNDLGKVFRIAQEDASHYYLVGYQVAQIPRDGRFRRIEVRTDQPGLQLSFRKGYYADKPFIALTQSEREQSLQRIIVDNQHPSDFELGISSEYFPQVNRTYLASVVLTFDYAELEKLADSDRLDLEVVILASRPQGEVTAGVRDEVEIRPRKNDSRPIFLYQNVLEVPQGDYQIRAYVRDNRRGHASSAETPLRIPPAEGGILLSSLVLAEGTQAAGTPEFFRIKTGKITTLLSNPLEVGGRLLIPRIPPRFRSSETLYFHGKVLVTAGRQSPERFRVILLGSNSRTISTGPWLSLKPNTSKDVLQYSGKTTLSGLEPGRYQLKVEVANENTPVTVQAEFEIDN